MSQDRSSDTTVLPDDPELLLQLTEYTNDSLWVFTADWKEVVFINSAYGDIFGQPVAELRKDPTSFLDGVHPNDREKVQDAMEELAAGSSVDLEFRVDPSEEYQTWVWVKGQPILDDQNEVQYVSGYTRDITDRKEYQQELKQRKNELERSNESLREFAYIASHDLQEPLRMVSSYVDLLDTEYGDQLDDEAQEYMEFAVNGAQRMKRMINSLLEYSRVHTEADEFEEIDLNEVFEDTYQDLELLIDDHNADVSVGDLPAVKADRNQVGQVFQNLVKNAIEHGSDDGHPRVEVTSTERDNAYEFAVSDNGPGVPENEQDDIFGIFRRGAAKSNTESTGIGLAITQRIVQRHGGQVWVESEGRDGATFKFTIPKAAAPTPRGSIAHD